MPTLGIITALTHEADVLPSPSNANAYRVIAGGVGSARARTAAEAHIAQGCEALLSFGFAGALEPGLPVGAVVLATAIRSPNGEEMETTPDWHANLAKTISRHLAWNAGVLIQTDRPAVTPQEKSDLREATKAIAVDMESYAIGEIAAASGVPFLALRVISDHARARLPRRFPLTEDGRTAKTREMLIGALTEPTELAPSVSAMWNGWRALQRLRRVASLCAPDFGL